MCAGYFGETNALVESEQKRERERERGYKQISRSNKASLSLVCCRLTFHGGESQGLDCTVGSTDSTGTVVPVLLPAPLLYSLVVVSFVLVVASFGLATIR